MTTANKVEFSIDDGETWSEEIEMVAGANTYSPEIGGVTYPVSLTFTADTGHTAGDEWELAYSDAGST